MRKRDRYKPAASKTTLLSLAGIFWLCIGSMLLSLAILWLKEAENINPYFFACPGVILGFFIYYFGFRNIVIKNTARILPAEEKMCVFAFMPLKSYLIIPIMISIGAILRHSPIPKQYLAIIYTGLGSAMILSSIRYLRVITLLRWR